MQDVTAGTVTSKLPTQTMTPIADTIIIIISTEIVSAIEVTEDLVEISTGTGRLWRRRVRDISGSWFPDIWLGMVQFVSVEIPVSRNGYCPPKSTQLYHNIMPHNKTKRWLLICLNSFSRQN